MYSFILKLFVKNYKDTQDPDVRRQYGVLTGISGIVLNSLLFIVKLVIGIASSSISVAADAVNNLSDTASSVMTLIGFKLSGKPADKEHPYGHARFEYLFGLIVSVVITAIGLQTLIGAVQKLIYGNDGAHYTKSAIIIIGLSIFIKVIMAVFVSRLGKAISSKALAATAADSVSDVITTSAIVIGMILTPITGDRTDGLLGCIVAIYIITVGIKLVIDTANPLIGTAPDKELIDKIHAILDRYDEILGVHDLMIHNYGAGRHFASVNIELDADMDIMQSHDLIDNIEITLQRELGVDTVIHMDPVFTDDKHLSDLKDKIAAVVTSLEKEYACDFSLHDFRLSASEPKDTILFDITLPCSSEEGAKNIDEEVLCRQIRERALKIAPECNIVITVDRNYTSRLIEGE